MFRGEFMSADRNSLNCLQSKGQERRTQRVRITHKNKSGWTTQSGGTPRIPTASSLTCELDLHDADGDDEAKHHTEQACSWQSNVIHPSYADGWLQIAALAVCARTVYVC